MLESFSKFRQDRSSSLTLNRSGDTRKGHEEHDTNYPCLKVKFLRSMGFRPIGSLGHNFLFQFHRTLEESKVEIASIQLDDDAIQ
ncbi:hypothetical protein BHM03_00038657 [Ensete ventricosum]|nr:hypothetical protein BHM03_00038657 [Ensete ventricosum]